MPALHPAARILPPATRQSAVVPAPGFRRAQAPRRWRAELEAADLATADHAFHVVDAAAGGGLHVGEVELADLRMLLRQAMEHAVERLHLPVVAVSRRNRFIAERIEPLRQRARQCFATVGLQRRLRSEEHTSDLQYL